MLPTFQWTVFDVSSMLPGDWRRSVKAVAVNADFRDFPRTPGLSREAGGVQTIQRGRVHADMVKNRLTWLFDLYRTGFRELAQCVAGEPVAPAADDRYGVVLNVQAGTEMRFECHVDSNPLTGLLFCSDHSLGAGGELVFAHDPAADSAAKIDRSCSAIRPQAGHLIFFDGRNHPHYARPLTSDDDMRVAAVMNYYTRSYPESMRPTALNRHLYGDR